MSKPAYLNRISAEMFEKRVSMANNRLNHCDLCPRQCGVNRNAGEIGSCKIGKKARVSSYGPHLGEEDPLRGWYGSGTIFFSGCNLACQYCQNFEISQIALGRETSPQEIAAIMLSLQNQGCHNINLVSPSHVVPQILASILIASQKGLLLPIVYNSGGYDSLSTLRLLDGVVDIYLPDMKYSDAAMAQKYSGIPNYPAINQAAVLEMHRQVGDLQINSSGLAERGLLVRHLVLPNNIAGTQTTVRFLAERVSPQTYLNIMAQYHPAFHANRNPALNRTISSEEYTAAVKLAIEAGLSRFDNPINHV